MKLASFKARFVRGFTLIELTISIGIMILLTGILLASYPESAIRITLINSVHKLALMVREAQVRGSAIDSANTSLGGYGVYIQLDTPTQITMFGDSVSGVGGTTSIYGLPVGNGLYEMAPVNELESVVTLPSDYVISKLCVGQAYPFTCNASGAVSFTSLTISFIRPSPQPSIYINASKDISYPAACIELRSPNAPLSGHIRSVEVYNSGMIRTTTLGCNSD